VIQTLELTYEDYQGHFDTPMECWPDQRREIG